MSIYNFSEDIDSDREYNIPKFIQEWNSVTQSYEKVKGEAIKAKNE